MLNGKEIQVGKRYTMRNGDTTEIVRFIGTESYQFVDEDEQSYISNGNFYSDGERSDFDLMCEVPSEDQQQEPLQDPEYDPVNLPKHYQLFPELNIEVKHVVALLADRLGTNGYNGAFIGDYVQLMQYLMRFDEKNGKEDLEKALFFLKSLLEGYPCVQKLKGQK